jgi:hypothetical protein
MSSGAVRCSYNISCPFKIFPLTELTHRSCFTRLLPLTSEQLVNLITPDDPWPWPGAGTADGITYAGLEPNSDKTMP